MMLILGSARSLHPPLEGEGRLPERSDGRRGGVKTCRFAITPPRLAPSVLADPPPPGEGGTELVLPLLSADHQKTARGVLANGHDAIDRGGLDKTMARGNGGVPPHDDAVGNGCARRICHDRAACRLRLELAPQGHDWRVAARDAAGAVCTLDRR